MKNYLEVGFTLNKNGECVTIDRVFDFDVTNDFKPCDVTFDTTKQNINDLVSDLLFNQIIEVKGNFTEVKLWFKYGGDVDVEYRHLKDLDSDNKYVEFKCTTCDPKLLHFHYGL